MLHVDIVDLFSPPAVQCPAKVPLSYVKLNVVRRETFFARDHYQPRVVTAILTIRETDAALAELDIQRGRRFCDFPDLCYAWHIIDIRSP